MLLFDAFIDPARFGTVRRRLNQPASPITDVIFVRRGTLLAHIAHWLVHDAATFDGARQLRRWLCSGQVSIGVTATHRFPTPRARGWIDLQSIPDDADCRVLYLPPFYLVHVSEWPAGHELKYSQLEVPFVGTPACVSARAVPSPTPDWPTIAGSSGAKDGWH